MGDCCAVKQETSLFEIVHDQRVSIFNKHSRPRGDCRLEFAFIVNGQQNRQIVGFRYLHIVHSKRRSNMNKPCAIACGHVIGVDNVMSRLIGRHKGVEGRILLAFESLSLHALEHFNFRLTKNQGNQFLCQDQAFIRTAFHPDHDVFHVRMGSHSHISRKSPGSSRPNKQICFGIINQRQTDCDAWVYSVGVTLRDLMIGERRAAARAIGNNLVAAVEQAFVPDLVKQPPYRFDIWIFVGHVRPA